MRLKLNKLKRYLEYYEKKDSLNLFDDEAKALKKILTFFVPHEVGIIILGMRGAGKTTLWNYLTDGKVLLQASSGVERIDECIIKINGVKRILKKTNDIAGADSIVHKYDKYITDEDLVLFMCNAKKILQEENNDEYIKDLRARLKKIFSHVQSLKNEKIKIHLIATHADQVETDSLKWASLKGEILELIGRPFLDSNNFDESNFILIDTSNKDCCEKYVLEFLFKK